MKNNSTQLAAKALALKLNNYTHKEGVEYEKMTMGVELILINVSKLFIIYLLAMFLGVVPLTLVVQGAYVAIKRYSFGLHALNSTVCTLVSCFIFVIVPWFLGHVSFNNLTVISIFVPIVICLYLYSPADTKARPLIGEMIRRKLKTKAVACGIMLMVIALLVPNETVKFLLTLGAVYQTVSILPFTYKILKRSEKNYEKFEQHA